MLPRHVYFLVDVLNHLKNGLTIMVEAQKEVEQICHKIQSFSARSYTGTYQKSREETGLLKPRHSSFPGIGRPIRLSESTPWHSQA